MHCFPIDDKGWFYNPVSVRVRSAAFAGSRNKHVPEIPEEPPTACRRNIFLKTSSRWQFCSPDSEYTDHARGRSAKIQLQYPSYQIDIPVTGIAQFLSGLRSSDIYHHPFDSRNAHI